MIKSALVTGAGGGLGRAVALALAERKCAVVALDINGPALEETAAEAASELITPLVMDLTMPGAPDLAVAESIDVLAVDAQSVLSRDSVAYMQRVQRRPAACANRSASRGCSTTRAADNASSNTAAPPTANCRRSRWFRRKALPYRC